MQGGRRRETEEKELRRAIRQGNTEGWEDDKLLIQLS